MRFKLPSIQSALNSNKKANENDPRKLIHVFEGYAIVSNDIIIVVDLRQHIKNELKIVNEDELAELTKIITWMNGKSFNKEFWSELTKEVLFKDLLLESNEIEIEYSGFNKKIQYLPNTGADNSHVLKLLKHNINREEVDMGRFAVNAEYFGLLNKCFASEMKSDNILLSLSGTGNGVKFSLARRDYIFGVIPESFEASMDMMAFDNNRNLFDVLTSNDIEDLTDDEVDLWADQENEENEQN